MHNISSEPLIYTCKGNLPISSLTYSVRWEDTADYTKLVETYTLADEVVRESAHVLAKKQPDLFSEQGVLGG
jgi:hypothetical protein